MKNLLTVLFLFCLFFSGCSSDADSTEFIFGKGKYKFTMTDSSKTEIANGILYVKTYDNKKISGTYEFKKILKKDFEGYSSMTGEFSGDVNTSEKFVFINTNPMIADANVFWNLKIKKSNLSGSWVYSVFRGAAYGGFVKITK